MCAMNTNKNTAELSRQSVDINIKICVEDNRKPDNYSRALPVATIPMEKIKPELSVPQLAYLFKLLLDLGIFKPRTQMNILNFISDNFQTPNTADISVRSLRSKYYTIDDCTKAAVKDILIMMLNQVNKLSNQNKKVAEVATEIHVPFRRIKKLLNKPKLKPDDILNESEIKLLTHLNNVNKIKELTKAEKKKKIRQREKANDKKPKQENPYAPKGATKFSKPTVIRTPTGGKVR